MFGRERKLCFAYGRRKMVLISRPRESGSGRQMLNMHGEIAVAETTAKDQQRVILLPFDHDNAVIRSSARVTIATFWIA